MSGSGNGPTPESLRARAYQLRTLEHDARYHEGNARAHRNRIRRLAGEVMDLRKRAVELEHRADNVRRRSGLTTSLSQAADELERDATALENQPHVRAERYAAGYRAGRSDRSLGIRSRYAEAPELGAYAMGYHDGVLGLDSAQPYFEENGR